MEGQNEVVPFPEVERHFPGAELYRGQFIGSAVELPTSVLIHEQNVTARETRFMIFKNIGVIDTAEERKDRKSTRLNSSHRTISYAVFCLKKKKKIIISNYSCNNM